MDIVSEKVKEWVSQFVAGWVSNRYFARNLHQMTRRGDVKGVPIVTNRSGYVDPSFYDLSALSDASFTLVDNSDATKKLQFQLSGITTGTTRTLTVPNASGTLALIDLAQTWTATQTLNGIVIHKVIYASETVTIASGAITVTKSKVLVNGEGGLADDLTTITGGGQDGEILILSRGGAVTITVKHGTGNIRLTGLADIALDNQRDAIELMFMQLANAWVQIGGGNNA